MDEYYKQYLFDFKDMMKAKLATLHDCFAPDGPSVLGTWEKYVNTTWEEQSLSMKDTGGAPTDDRLNDFGYGGRVKATVS